jgi:hypothetical protein
MKGASLKMAGDAESKLLKKDSLHGRWLNYLHVPFKRRPESECPFEAARFFRTQWGSFVH